MMKVFREQFSWSELAWNLWCLCSVIGIWPRFIEPRLISTTHLTLPLADLPAPLKGLKILQFSDLHLNQHTSKRFIRKLHRKARELQPDLIVFTGDFLCGSDLKEPAKLTEILNGFQAPYGCYAILGNHDYAHYVSIGPTGDYDRVDEAARALKKGWKRLFRPLKLTKKMTKAAQETPLHTELLALLANTPFKLLHNETIPLSIQGQTLNLCGLGEYILGRFLPEQAFKNYDRKAPGIILAHNPDGIPLLNNYPGEIILSGHTHGSQVNLPGLSHRFILLENMHFKSGLFKVEKKWAYVNRGLGGNMRFRWFSPPELLLLTLDSK